MRPDNDEARAAHYNAACCYTALGQWEEAAENLVAAVNEYDLKFSVAIKVPFSIGAPEKLLAPCAPQRVAVSSQKPRAG